MKPKHSAKRFRRAPGRSPTGFTAFVVRETPAAAKIAIIRSGVTARVVDEMVRYLDVSTNDIFRVLRTPESTAHKLIKDNRPLDTAASERVVRVADITRLAVERFGGRGRATVWPTPPTVAAD